MLRCVRWQARARGASRVVNTQAQQAIAAGSRVHFHVSSHALEDHRTTNENGVPTLVDKLRDRLASIVTNSITAIQKAPMPSVQQLKELSVAQQLLGLKDADRRVKELGDVVFVCLDLEAYEMSHSTITEIGVSIFDPQAVKNVPSSGAAWLPKIESAHYLIEEHRHLVNKRFVKGHPDSFGFGRSQPISNTNAKEVMKSIFANPNNLSQAHKLEQTTRPSGRPIVLVGHALQSDVKFLEYIGLSIADVDQIVHRMDTQGLAGTKKRQISLKKLLTALGVEPSFLHNAGNDAAYTLQALLLFALREHEQPDSIASKLVPHYQRQNPENPEQPMSNRRLKKEARRRERAENAQKGAGVKSQPEASH